MVKTAAQLGSYQREIRVNGRLFIGLGHTPDEAHRNACDLAAERFPAIATAIATIRSRVGNTAERTTFKRCA